MNDWKELLKAIDSDDENLLYDIACYLDLGIEVDGKVIVKENKSEAFKLYEKLSNNGHLYSMIRLADFYSEGEVCLKNIDLAKELYTKGVEGGNGIAAHNLATLYRDLGNYSQAFELYQTAERLYNSNLIQVAYCFYYGIGVNQDREQALTIFDKIARDESESRSCEFDIENANYYLGLYYLEGVFVEKSIDKAREYFERANVDNDHRNANEILLMIGRKY